MHRCSTAPTSATMSCFVALSRTRSLSGALATCACCSSTMRPSRSASGKNFGKIIEASLPPPLALFHFDTAVNQGVGAAARMLQQALSVIVDGEIGPITLAAASSCDTASALDRYANLRRDRYRALPAFWRFGKGWLARVDATQVAAARLSSNTPATIPQTKEPPMTDTTTQTSSASASQPKWWGQSLTIWGTIVTTLSTVLPIVGPLIGIQISADTVHQIGDGLVQVVQALGGVIGVLMTVYGRSRAIQPLVRRDFLVKL